MYPTPNQKLYILQDKRAKLVAKIALNIIAALMFIWFGYEIAVLQYWRNQALKSTGEISEQSSARESSVSPTRSETKSASLEVQKLKTYQNYDSATIDFKVTNKSNVYLSFWQIDADVYDFNNQYLAHSYTNGQNLRPGQSFTGSLIIPNVKVKDIASWKPAIGGLYAKQEDGQQYDPSRYFDLKEVK